MLETVIESGQSHLIFGVKESLYIALTERAMNGDVKKRREIGELMVAEREEIGDVIIEDRRWHCRVRNL